jgi:hypothetical protein
MRLLVLEHRGEFRGRERRDRAAREHDPAGPAGQGVREAGVIGHDADSMPEHGRLMALTELMGQTVARLPQLGEFAPEPGRGHSEAE